MNQQPPARRRCRTKPPPAMSEIVLLLGCTASGKTAVSLELARRLDAEILSIDSMQVYRRMDIGTAKPSPQERAAVPHHLINVAEPSESFSVARFVELADAAIADIAGRGRRVLALAGTPLYLMGLMYGMFDGPSADERLRAELRGRAERDGTPALHAELTRVDPEAAARIHPNDYKRIERALEVWRLTGRRLSEQQRQWSAGRLRYPAKVVGLRRQKDDNSRRINARVKQMIEAGLVDEVRSLLAEPCGTGVSPVSFSTGKMPVPHSKGEALAEPAGLSEQARQALGYAQIIAHLRGEMTLEETVEEIKIQTRRLAKHQRTWFRKFAMTEWVDISPDEPAAPVAERLWQSLTL